MARRPNSTSQFYLSPTQWASPAALAKFWQQLWVQDIHYWGPNCVVRILDLADRELQDIPIGTLLLLPVLPFRVSYPVNFESQLTHKCRYCPQIDYPGNNYPIHEFHLESAAESHPPSDAKLSSSSSVAESQSSHRSLSPSSSTAELQASSQYNYRSDNTSNPHSPGLDNWQSNRLWSDSYINGPSEDSSNP